MNNGMFPDHAWVRDSPTVQGRQGLVLEDEKLTDVPSGALGRTCRKNAVCWLSVSVKKEGPQFSEKPVKYSSLNEYLCETTFFPYISHKVTPCNKPNAEGL